MSAPMEQKWECTAVKPNGHVVIAGSAMTPTDMIPWLGSAPGESLSIDQFKTEMTEMVTVPAGTEEPDHFMVWLFSLSASFRSTTTAPGFWAKGGWAGSPQFTHVAAGYFARRFTA